MDNNGQMPLSRAAGYGKEAIGRLLVERQAVKAIQNKYGRRPLLWSAKNGNEAINKLLIERDLV
jgi:ankyrin repeat protein